MNIRKAAARVLCAVLMLLPFGGCREKPEMLDGPGMINDLSWGDFTITSDGSFSDYAFTLKVEHNRMGDGVNTVSGELQDANGEVYILEKTEIMPDDFIYLRSLFIGDLVDIEDETQRNPHVQMNIHYLDGTPQEKEISEELAAEICAQFLPYFNINNT
jgi:hypothetical protein